jgi:hypothetical protein
MTHYDNLMDSIVDEIYYVWTEVSSWNADDQKTARETAHRILQHIEEFQSTRSRMKTTQLKPRPQWRASD